MIRNTQTLQRRYRPVVRAVFSALAILSSQSVLADQLLGVKLFRDSEIMFRDDDLSRWTDNYVEIGHGYNSNDSFRFGQFSGITESGTFPIAGFNWLSRAPKNDAQYWTIHGANLGLDSRKIKAGIGIQGTWDVSLSIDQMNKSQTESATFLHENLGTNYLTLPGGNKPGVTTFNDATKVDTKLLKPYSIQHGRDILRFDFSGLLDGGWDYKISLREDRRDGTRITGLPNRWGNRPKQAGDAANYSAATSGSGISTLVPYPIDDRTLQWDATIGYNSKEIQAQLNYTFSSYDTKVHWLTVDNPYNHLVGSQTQPLLRLSLAPSNDYHQINGTAAYRFDKNTRLMGKVSYAVSTQDEPFLPFSANGAAATAPLPRASLDGKVVNTMADVSFLSKPLEDMSLRVGYQYRDHHNQTPRIEGMDYASRDTNTLPATLSAGARSTAPVSTTEQKLGVDADYKIADRTTLQTVVERTGKVYHDIDRNGSFIPTGDRLKTNTDKISLDLRRPVSDEIVGNVGYVYTRRTGTDYNKLNFARLSYSSTTLLTNHPSVRSFMYSDFDEGKLRASSNWIVNDALTLQAGVEAGRQRNRGPDCNVVNDPTVAANTNFANMAEICLGRTEASVSMANIDVQWQPEENLTTFAFGNISRNATEQRARNRWAANATAKDFNRDYLVHTVNADRTLGLGFKWQAVKKWGLGGSYVNQAGKGTTEFEHESSTPASFTGMDGLQAMPEIKTTLHTLQLFAKFDQSKQISWRFNYVYENLKATDWSYDVSPTANPSVLLTGQEAPRYINHVIGVSTTLSW